MQNILRFPKVSSTNDYIFSLKGDELFKHGLVVFADYQTNGRGQRGNYWESEKGKNLIMSMLIEPRLLVKSQFDINKIVCLAIVESLSSLGFDSKIKWPNDIMIGQKKVGGILIQNMISNNIILFSVIGIGLNVNQSVFNKYSPKATSFILEKEQEFNLLDIQQIVLSMLNKRLKMLFSEGKDKDDYLNLLFKKDQNVRFKSKSKIFNGVIRGVESSGLLLVEVEGVIKQYNSKEIKMLF